ncbi:hypothetical protein DICA3_F32660 [Diutina catenulata]
MPPRLHCVSVSLVLRSFQLVVAVAVLGIAAWLRASENTYLNLYLEISLGAFTIVYVIVGFLATTPVYVVFARPAVALLLEVFQFVYWGGISVYGGLTADAACVRFTMDVEEDTSHDKGEPSYESLMAEGVISSPEDYYDSKYAPRGGDEYCQANWAAVALSVVASVLFLTSVIIQGYFAWWPTADRRGFWNAFKPMKYYTGQLFLRPFEAPEEMADYPYRLAYDTEKQSHQMVDASTVSTNSSRERITSF